VVVPPRNTYSRPRPHPGEGGSGGQQTTTNSQQIEDTRNQVKQVDEKAQSGISAATEKAVSADQHAATADQHAGAADQHASTADQHATDAMGKANQVGTGLAGLRNVVANIDDYKPQGTVAVQFGLSKFVLSTDAKADLDKFADSIKGGKRLRSPSKVSPTKLARRSSTKHSAASAPTP